MADFLSKMDKISIKILLSYLSILLIPLCAIVLINLTSTHTILEAQNAKNLYSLEQTAKTVNMYLDELRHITSYIGSDSRTNSIVNRSRYTAEGKTDIFSLFQLVNAFPNYRLTNHMIEEVYIFFNNMDYTAKLPSAFPSTRYAYDNFVGFRGIPFENMEALRTESHTGRVHIGFDSSGCDFLLLHSFPGAGTPQGLVVIRISEQAIRDILHSNDVGPGGGVYILDDQGRLLTFIGECAPDFARIPLEDLPADGLSHDIRIDGNRYIASSLTSGNWTYLSLTSKAHLLKDFTYIRVTVLMLGAASVLLGATICFVLWRRRHRFYKQISSCARSSGLQPLPAKNEHSFLENTVNSFMDEVGSLRTTLQQQGQLLANTILLNLLQGGFETASRLQKELETSELDLSANGYHIVHVALPAAAELQAGGHTLLSYRLHIKQKLAMMLDIPYLSCDLDNRSFSLILLEHEPCTNLELGELFLTISIRLEDSDGLSPCFALSGVSCDLAQIPVLYRQAEDTQEYMALLGLKGCLTIDNLPRTEDLFYYPLTNEIRLIQLIRKGNPADLELFLHMLQKENILRRSLPLAMLRELCEAMRRNVLRAIQDTAAEEDTAPSLARLVSEVEHSLSLAEILACARRANRLLNRIAETQNEQEHAAMRDLLRTAVEEQLSNPAFNLYTISLRTGHSENTLYRNFKVCFGVSFSEYLEQRRIDRACQLLAQQLPIKEVAVQSGYTSDHTFRRAFKRLMKVLPSQYAGTTPQ